MPIKKAYDNLEKCIKDRSKGLSDAEAMKKKAEIQFQRAKDSFAQAFYDAGLFKGQWDLTDADYDYTYEIGRHMVMDKDLKDKWDKVFYVNGGEAKTSSGISVLISFKSQYGEKPSWRISKIYPTEIPAFLLALEKDGIHLKIKHYQSTIKRLRGRADKMQEIVDKWTLDKINEL